MQDKRRHQRIRFSARPIIRIGSGGVCGQGEIENLSVAGLMLRTEMPLQVGRRVGCEFSVFGSPCIDVPAVVVSRVGDLYGVRFDAGPASQLLLADAIPRALAGGHASVLTMHETGGRKVMRIAGSLNGTLRNDVMHSLTKVGVDEIDVSGVTTVDQEGLDLCLLAQGRYGARIGRQSECFNIAWQQVLQLPGSLSSES